MKKLKVFLFLSLIILACSCETKNSDRKIAASKEIFIDSASGSCPYLTKDNLGNVVLSWIKQRDSANSIFCYAISKDDGETFGKSIEVAGSSNVQPHGENMPKIIFKPTGEIMAVWGASNPNPKNAYAGWVYYSQSFDAGNTWSGAKSLTADTASFDQRYFDVALLPNGEAGITWLDNRKEGKKEGSGLFYAVTKGTNGFQDEQMISGPCCQCCRTDLFVDKEKNIHVAYRGIINDSIRDMVHIVSTDDGRSFTKPQRISADNWMINGCPHTGPAMAENKDGLHFAWFTGGKGAGTYYNSSTNNGQTFTAREMVSGRASKHCQIISMAGDNMLIVWNENFVKGNQSSSRIGIEEKNAEGKTVSNNYITAENGNASFPVICPVSSTKAVVAYTENRNNKDRVLLKQVVLE